MKKILIVFAVILAFGSTAAGSFYGGTVYQSKQAEQVRNDFFNARGLASDGQFPGEGLNPEDITGGQRPAGQFPGGLGSGTTGTIKSIEGDVMTISTATDVTTVQLSATTPVLQTVAGTPADLQPGMRVRILGQADGSGAITASQITILDDSQDGQPRFDPLGDPPPENSDPVTDP